MTWYICLNCRHEYYATRDETTTQRRCSVCASTRIIKRDIHEQIIRTLEPVISDTTPILDTLNCLLALSIEQGNFLGPTHGIEIVRYFVKEIERRKRETPKMRK